MKFSLKGSEKNKKSYSKGGYANEKKSDFYSVISSMISSMVVAGGVTAHAEENVTLNVFDAHAYGLEEYGRDGKSLEESHPGVTVDVQQCSQRLRHTASVQSKLR